MPCIDLEDAVELIRMEYADRPELRVTRSQAQRLWELPDQLCQRALNDLTRSGFLTQMNDGSYVRRT